MNNIGKKMYSFINCKKKNPPFLQFCSVTDIEFISRHPFA